MTLTKLVNGVRRNLTAEEQVAREAEWAANQQEKDDYQRDFAYLDNRRAAYPPMEEQIEAIFAGFKKMQDDGATLDPLTSTWVTNMQNIHDANPPPGV